MTPSHSDTVPLSQSPTAAQLQEWEQGHPERREAEIETLTHDLHTAMDFIAQLTHMAYDGNYDEQYEALVRCGVQALDTRIEKAVASVQGLRKP